MKHISIALVFGGLLVMLLGCLSIGRQLPLRTAKMAANEPDWRIGREVWIGMRKSILAMEFAGMGSLAGLYGLLRSTRENG